MEEYYIYYLDKKIKLSKNKEYRIGRSSDSDIRLPDERVSRKHAILNWSKDAFILSDQGSTNGTFVNDSRIPDSIKLLNEDRIRIGPHDLQFIIKSEEEEIQNPDETLIFEKEIIELSQEIEDPKLRKKILSLKLHYNKKRDSLSGLAYKDELTRLFNRRYFNQKLQEEVERSRRYSRNLSLIMCDIDHFKKFNDTYGHQTGDKVLQKVAELIINNCRASDIPARYGGEEIAVILPETDINGAYRLAEKARIIIEEKAADAAGTVVTVSMGVASFTGNKKTPEDLISAADKCLYKAKESGRNRTTAENETE